MILRTINLNGEEYISVDDFIDDLVEDRATDCGEYNYSSIADRDDEAIDMLVDFLIGKDRKDIAMKLKRAWIKKRYGSFFRE